MVVSVIRCNSPSDDSMLSLTHREGRAGFISARDEGGSADYCVTLKDGARSILTRRAGVLFIFESSVSRTVPSTL